VRWLKRLGWFSLGFAGLFGLLFLVGLFLPARHRAQVEARFAQPCEVVWQTITDLEATPTWRRGLDSINREADRDGKPVWRLEGDFGTMVYQVDLMNPPERYVNRVVDHEGFGGTWTFALADAGADCRLRIEEDSEVTNPIFRTMIRFVYGYGTSMENYLEDLAAVLDQREPPP
jgi:hypothetical protein